ncbi:MAG: hypothetical protein V4671_21030, partial [Armatimonadota bacterium]
ANTAGEWLNGRFVGAHSRDYHAVHGPENPGAGTVAAWLYFGGRSPDLTKSEAHYAVVCALSGYRIPDILTRIARDRSAPYVHRETHDRMEGDGTVEGRGPYISRAGVAKYTYVAPRWALGSMTDGPEGALAWCGQLRRWSLDWDTDHPGGALFFTHPFPGSADADGDYLSHWVGSSPYEQVIQHEGSLIAVYRIPEASHYKFAHLETPIPSDRDPYIEGFFSRTALCEIREDPSGWIFCHGGSVLIAVRPLRPYHWRDGGTRLRSPGLKNAVVVEAAGVEAFARSGDPPAERIAAELTRFRGAHLRGAHLDVDLESDHPAVSYAAPRGDTLRITYDGPREINGNRLDFSSWPLLENPWMSQAVGSGVLSLSHGGESQRIDL